MAHRFHNGTPRVVKVAPLKGPRITYEDQPIERAEERWEEIGLGVERFRLPDGEPVRRLITGRRNRKVGAHYSQKMGSHVVYESATEERCAKTMDCHSDVLAFYAQPETIRVKDEEEPFRYTPDFRAVFAAGEAIVEVKRWCDLHPLLPISSADIRGWRRWEKAKETRKRLRQVRKAYRRAGMLWILVTDIDLDAIANPDVVDEIIAHAGRPITDLDRIRLYDHFSANNGVATLASCAGVIHDATDPLGTIIARIAEGALSVDLQRPLDEDAPVQLVR